MADNDSKSTVDHITQEMYKKNVELAERNKTLSLLRKIDEIILSAVTDIKQVGQEVTTAIVTETGFAVVGIFLQDKKNNALSTLSFFEATSLTRPISYAQQAFSNFSVSLNESNNLMVHSIQNKSMQFTSALYDIIRPFKTEEEVKKIQADMKMSSFALFPLIIRREVTGILLIGFAEAKNELLQFEKDLIDRLPEVIAIAIDNSLLYQKIQEANVRLKELDKLKDDFVSVASHELRTPMTAIKSYLWMALAGRGGELSTKQKYYLDRAYNSTDRLIKLVNDMLNISRIESGRMTFIMEKIDLAKLIQDTIEEVKPRADELGLTVALEPATLAIPSVIADPDKLKEVLINLIGNSLKFTPRNGSITLRLLNEEGKVRVDIQDTGRGIEKDDLPKLFQKFGLIQGSYATNQNVVQGTGLGLFICKSIVDYHGGTISVSSPGRDLGSVFSFTLLPYNEVLKQAFAKKNENKETIGVIHTTI